MNTCANNYNKVYPIFFRFWEKDYIFLGIREWGKKESNREVSCGPDVYRVCTAINEKVRGFFPSVQLI